MARITMRTSKWAFRAVSAAKVRTMRVPDKNCSCSCDCVRTWSVPEFSVGADCTRNARPRAGLGWAFNGPERTLRGPDGPGKARAYFHGEHFEIVTRTSAVKEGTRTFAAPIACFPGAGAAAIVHSKVGNRTLKDRCHRTMLCFGSQFAYLHARSLNFPRTFACSMWCLGHKYHVASPWDNRY